jgi:single-strand DNA-binding protein
MQNIVILAGNIGQKPETRTTQGGTNITNFTLATSRPRLSEGRVMRDENGYRVMDTEWHRITGCVSRVVEILLSRPPSGLICA